MVIKGYTSRINLRLQPPGRAKQSLITTRALADAEPDPTLLRICDYGLDGVGLYVDLRARRRIQRVARSAGEARTLDRAVDIFIGDIVQALKRVPGRYPHHPERHEWARVLLATYFPDGALAITNLPYEEELIVAEYIHHHLTTEHADWCRALRIMGLLDDLGEILPAYREALTPDELISVDDVNAAFDQIQHALCAAVAHVMARFWRVEDSERRDHFLRPILDQDARMAELLAARRSNGGGGDVVELDVLPEGDAGDGVADLEDGGEAAVEVPAAVEAAPEADPPTLRPLPPGDG